MFRPRSGLVTLSRMRRMRIVLWSLGAAAFLLNPAFACGGDSNDTYQYGAIEMRAAVEGTWSFSIAFDDGQQGTLTVKVAQADAVASAVSRETREASPSRRTGIVRSAEACGSRTLVKTAAACVSTTQMPLTVTFVAGDEIYRTATLVGSFNVLGTLFQQGEVVIAIGGSTYLGGTISPTGQFTAGTLSMPAATVTATRIGR